VFSCTLAPGGYKFMALIDGGTSQPQLVRVDPKQKLPEEVIVARQK
jgi:hypothetical protein